MDALEWDEEEIITRHRSWPEGTGLDRVLARPRVRVLGMHEVVEQHLDDPMPVLIHSEVVAKSPPIEPPTRKLDRARIREEMAQEESVEIDLEELEIVEPLEVGNDGPEEEHSEAEVIELGSGEIFVEDHHREVRLRESLDVPAPAESLPFHYRSELEVGLDGQALDPGDELSREPAAPPRFPEARSPSGYDGLFSSFDQRPPTAVAPEEEIAARGERAYDEPAYAYDEPAHAYDEPADAYDEHAHHEPAYREPAYDEHAYDEPAYDEPAYDEPAYDEPSAFDDYKDHGARGDVVSQPIADFDAALSDWPPGPTAPHTPSSPRDTSPEVPFDAFDGRVQSFEPPGASPSFTAPSRPKSDHSGAFTALPDTWSSAGLPLSEPGELPAEDDWAHRSRTLMPVERSRTVRPRLHPEPRAWLRGNWAVGAALAATLFAGMGIVVGVNALWPKRGALRIDLADPTVAADGVFIDGQRFCTTTPCVVEGLDEGSRDIRILLAGGTQALSETHAVKAGTQTIVLMKPVSAPAPAPAPAPPRARLILGSPTSGITVSVDGKSRGTLPLTLAELAPGEHQLEFSAPGRKTLEKRVKLADHETQRLDDVTLELETGRLQIALKTPGTRVLLAPRRGYRKNLVGPYPKQFEVAPGNYEVIAIRPGFRPQVIPVVIDDAHPSAEVTIELNPMPFVPPSQDIYE